MLVESKRYIDLVLRIASDRGSEADQAELSLLLDAGFAEEARVALREVLHLRNIDARWFADRHAVAERMVARMRSVRPMRPMRPGTGPSMVGDGSRRSP